MVKVVNRLGIFLVFDKLEGLIFRLVFFGILVNFNFMECFLFFDKFFEFVVEYYIWFFRKKCIKREFFFFIGKFNFVCRIILVGYIFLRRLIDLSIIVRRFYYYIFFNIEVRWDVVWWLKYLFFWNGRVIIFDFFWLRFFDFEFFIDVFGGFGFGIYF